MKTISLTQNQLAIVDERDHATASQHKWYFMNNGYAARRPWDKIKKRYFTVYLHHFIVGKPEKGLVVDHINGNTLDNRRENLRFCSHKENIRRSKKKRITNTSGIIGVGWHKQRQKWYARITVDYKVISLGLFENKDTAAIAYQSARKKYFGELNV